MGHLHQHGRPLRRQGARVLEAPLPPPPQTHSVAANASPPVFLLLVLPRLLSQSRKAQKSWTPEERALYDQNRQAMELMIRYINLGHLLLLTEAQKSELGDFAETLEKRFGRWARERVKTVPVLRYVLLLDREGAMVDILGNPKKTFTNLMGAMTDVFQLGNAVTGSDLAHIGIQTEEEREREEKLRVEGDLGFDRFRRMGLVTADEWEKLKLGEKDGNPKWRSCFQWCASRTHTCARARVNRLASALVPPLAALFP